MTQNPRSVVGLWSVLLHSSWGTNFKNAKVKVQSMCGSKYKDNEGTYLILALMQVIIHGLYIFSLHNLYI